MNKLFVKDNTRYEKIEFKDVRNIANKVADKTFQQLEEEGLFLFPNIIRDSEDITEEQTVLQSQGGNYWTHNVVGYLGYKDESLIISSRFTNKEDDYFFQYMLKDVMKFPNIVNFDAKANRDFQFFNIVVFLFPYYLKLAIRKGIFKTYINRQFNDENIKGTIDIARHIKENTPFLGKIVYNQRLFSVDNYLIMLIRHTIEFIGRKSYGRELLRHVKDEVETIVNATPHYNYSEKNNAILENIKNPVRHAYYREYRNLQKLCILILRNEQHEINEGPSHIYGILFDCSWLWEEYVNNLVKDNFYHPNNKNRTGGQRLFEGNKGYIYPDFIGKNDFRNVIADAKYKPSQNIRGKDYLQLVAYMYRFDSKLGFYFYPEIQGNEEDEKLKLGQGSTYEKSDNTRNDIFVYKCGLAIPQNVNDYEDFEKQIIVNENEFIKKLYSYKNSN